MYSPDYSKIYTPSSSSARNYKILRFLNLTCYVLVGIIALLGLWTILKVAGAFGDNVPDLADLASIRAHFTARLVTILAIITVILVAFKEWKYGDRGFGTVYFLTILLAVWLFPVVAAELEPDPAQLKIEFTLNYCEAGGIEGTSVVDNGVCKIVPPEDVAVLMSNADPVREDALIREPDSNLVNLSRWNVEARGSFNVYFMLQHESMDACENAVFATDRVNAGEVTFDCIEHDGATWSVHQFETSENQTGRLVLFQEKP